MWIRKTRPWQIAERLATPESVYFNRRKFLQKAGAAGIGAVALGCAGQDSLGGAKKGGAPRQGLRGQEAIDAALRAHPGLYPASRNEKFKLDRPLTDEKVAAIYNNFYEFKNDKQLLPRYAQQLTLRPWTVEVTGLVDKPLTLDVDDLLNKLPVEERLYRHRCVERWAMAVPWTGIPMKKFVELASPKPAATYVRFVSFLRPEEAIGQREDTWYPWPYYEGLTLAEATNELTLLTTGIYGKPLPPQHGAPIRIVTPWKYGYKSIKSIVRIEFTAKQPPTFWNDLQPQEYGFVSNVNPNKPHPRWSQKVETMLGTREERATLIYNGYAEWVADLYA